MIRAFHLITLALLLCECSLVRAAGTVPVQPANTVMGCTGSACAPGAISSNVVIGCASCAADGTADDSAALTTSLTSLSGNGYLRLNPGKFTYSATGFTVPSNTGLDCGAPFSSGKSPNNVWGMNSGNVFGLGPGPAATILLAPTATITLGAGSVIQNCNIVRSTLLVPSDVLPALQEIATNFTGTAITVGGGGSKIQNVTIIGFNLGIDIENQSRTIIRDVYSDNNQVFKVVNSNDVDHFERVFQNSGYIRICSNFPGGCPASLGVRPGPGFFVSTSANAAYFDNVYCYDCLIGFKFDTVYQNKMNAGGAEMPGTGNSYNTSASFTGAISGTTLTVSAISSGGMSNLMVLTGAGITAGTTVLYQLTGTSGSTGTYVVSASQSVSSESMVGTITSYGIYETGATSIVDMHKVDFSGQTYPAYITGSAQYLASNNVYGANGSTTNFIYADSGTFGADLGSTFGGGVSGSGTTPGSIHIDNSIVGWNFLSPTFNGQTTTCPFDIAAATLPAFGVTTPIFKGSSQQCLYQNVFNAHGLITTTPVAAFYGTVNSGQIGIDIGNFGTGGISGELCFDAGVTRISCWLGTVSGATTDMELRMREQGGSGNPSIRWICQATSSTAFNCAPNSGQAMTSGSSTVPVTQSWVSQVTSKPLTVATLVSTCSGTTVGSESAVSDATSPTHGSTVVGGGAVFAKVICNGTNWVVEYP